MISDKTIEQIKNSYKQSSPWFSYRISIYPSVRFTLIFCLSFISFVTFSTPTTAGRPYSRVITAPWDIAPPTSVTSPAIVTKTGVQLGKKEGVIEKWIPDEAILSYLNASITIMQNPDYLKTNDEYKLGISRLFLYGLLDLSASLKCFSLDFLLYLIFFLKIQIYHHLVS